MALQTGAGGAQGEALLACILDMGELLLVSGAEVRRVEDTLTRLCAAYGFERADVFTITSSIVLTAAAPGGRVLTQTRRIRERCAQPLELAGLRRAVEEVRQGRAYPPWVQCAAYAVVSAAFTVFFGGAARDALAAALSGALLAGALALGRRLPLGDLLLNLLCSAFAALAAAALAALGVGVSPEKIIIGNIMLLIPGLGLTVSLRDMIGGDTISGLLGLCEAVLKALAVAAGFAVVLLRAGG